MGRALAMLHSLPTCVQEITWKCPAQGKFILVGSVPVECTDEYKSGFTIGRKSKVYDSLEEAEAAIKAAGVTKWQRPDCSWAGV